MRKKINKKRQGRVGEAGRYGRNQKKGVGEMRWGKEDEKSKGGTRRGVEETGRVG